MAACVPCRVSRVEHDDGHLWLDALKLDAMVKMGRKLPLSLKKEEAQAVRDTLSGRGQRASRDEGPNCRFPLTSTCPRHAV